MYFKVSLLIYYLYFRVLIFCSCFLCLVILNVISRILLTMLGQSNKWRGFLRRHWHIALQINLTICVSVVMTFLKDVKSVRFPHLTILIICQVQVTNNNLSYKFNLIYEGNFYRCTIFGISILRLGNFKQTP